MENEVCVICLEKGNLFKQLYHLPCNCNYYIHKKCDKGFQLSMCKTLNHLEPILNLKNQPIYDNNANIHIAVGL